MPNDAILRNRLFRTFCRRGVRRCSGGTTCLWLAAMIGLLLTAGQPVHAEPSALWGEAGEAWSPDSRLPDFSFAGFERGEAALPRFAGAPVHDVREYGARGDGEHDDTAAFHAAIEAAQQEDGAAVVKVPPGRYVITDFVDITRSRVVLRGNWRCRASISGR